MNKFCIGHLAANVRVRCSDFSKLRVYAVYSNRRPPSLFGEHCEIAMAGFEENVKEIVEMTRKAAGGDRVWRGRDRRQDGGDDW